MAVDPADTRNRLAGELIAWDGDAARATLDYALEQFGLTVTLRDVVLPYLAELGGCWARGEASVAQEHYATRLIQSRLLSLARDWDSGSGPVVVAACPPGERHEIGLIAFGIVVRASGWRVGYLGADTPVQSIAEAARALDADLTVLSSVASMRFVSVRNELRALAEERALALGGAGASATIASALGASHLDGDPVRAADWVARMAGAREAAG